MARLKKQDVNAAADLPTEEVAVPEWGGEVLVRGLSGRDKDAFVKETVSRNGAEQSVEFENITARLLARCLVDDAGERLFDDASVPDLGRKSGAVLTRLFKVAQRLSGLEEAAVAEAEKN